MADVEIEPQVGRVHDLNELDRFLRGVQGASHVGFHADHHAAVRGVIHQFPDPFQDEIQPGFPIFRGAAQHGVQYRCAAAVAPFGAKVDSQLQQAHVLAMRIGVLFEY